MKHKLFFSFLCLPLLTGCSYLFPSHDQKNFKADSPPKEDQTALNASNGKAETKNSDKQERNHPKNLSQKSDSTNSSAKKTEAPEEEVLSGNQPMHHISSLSSPDPTAMEDVSNPTLSPAAPSAPTVGNDEAPALSARQQERQAAIKLRDSLERIQNGKSNNSEEDRQLSELPASQRKAMLEQLNQALATR